MFGKSSKQPWRETTRISCGVLLRRRTDVAEHQCPKCDHWSIRWAESVESKFCPHCGARIISGKN